MKKLELTIFERGTNYRKGVLYLNGEQVCYTLEPSEGWLYQTDLITEIENAKKLLRCAIPYGLYDVKFMYSPKFKKTVPHILNVPGFDAVEIHVGNIPRDTTACVLVGKQEITGVGNILNSQQAWSYLVSRLLVNEEEGITIEIKPK